MKFVTRVHRLSNHQEPGFFMLTLSIPFAWLPRHHAFGVGNGKFWLDDVKCSGEEDSIDKCSHRPWGRNNCQIYSQAGAVCRQRLNDLIVEPKPSQASGQV